MFLTFFKVFSLVVFYTAISMPLQLFEHLKPAYHNMGYG